MARITIQDCLDYIPSRFDLTMVAAKRARQLARGADPKLPWNGHKSTVLALQEIAQGCVTAAVLEEVDLPVVKPPVATLDALDNLMDDFR
ncbi:MAG TPA: DNA-directed RNA polymerase subunit omega [Verrucomicrobiae bacterium]|nr:DNA-directed RNA polymerase subunit omega [Verrucomicrobiae bacterium]